MEEDYLKGRGAQINTANPFFKNEYVTEHIEGLDEPLLSETPQTQLFFESPKKIISKNKSPDIPFYHSVNPYQGCEHGCIYCYARNAHEYWGFSAGLDFESKIIIKKNAATLLEKEFLSKTWKSSPIMLSGNTDCYQPVEKKLKITRSLLQVFLKYGNPVSLITKNSLIERDMDLLKELAKDNLVHVYITITTLDEEIRRVMEPRTAAAVKKLRTIQKLSSAGIPTGVMVAPIIPGINIYEIAKIIQKAAEHGATGAGYTVVRLNGSIGAIFKDWLYKNFPDRAEKVWHQIQELHGGTVHDNRWNSRMIGEGSLANSIRQLFKIAKNKYLKDRSMPAYNLTKFRSKGNFNLFS